MFTKNAVIITIAGSNDYGVRAIFATRTKQVRQMTYDDESNFSVAGSGEMVALQIASHNLEMYANISEYKGNIALVMPRNAAVRCFSILAQLNMGVSADKVADVLAKKVSKSFEMSELHKASITAMATALSRYQNGRKVERVRIYDAFNLEHWRLAVDADVELKEGQKLTFSATEDGTIEALDGKVVLETTGSVYAGEHEVVRVQDGVDAERNPRYSWAIKRIGESQRLKNVQKLWTKFTLSLFNEEDDIDTMDVIRENEEAEAPEMDLDEMDVVVG